MLFKLEKHHSITLSDIPNKSQIKKGSHVFIETKEEQGTGKLYDGIVKDILTLSDFHPYGIKVRLEDEQVGRVKRIGVQTQIPTSENTEFEDLDKKKIPHTEDKHNEFKEFYQYDKKLENQPKNDKQFEGLKKSVQERFATAICSFGNDKNGGFVYLGIQSDGNIVGLEKDKKFGGFSDYKDSFANHIRDTLGYLIPDKVFIASKLQIKFREIDNRTICIIQILSSSRPLYLHAKEKTFYVRGPAPRAEKLDVEEQFRYIKERYPNYE